MPWTAADVERLTSDTKGKWTAESVDNLLANMQAGNPVNINDPLNKLSPVERDRAEQARRAKTLTNLSQEPVATSQTVSPSPFKATSSTIKTQDIGAALLNPKPTQPVTDLQGLINKLDTDTQLIKAGALKIPEPQKPTIGDFLQNGVNNITNDVKTVGNAIKNIVTDPLGSIVKAAENFDQTVKSNPVYQDIMAGVGQVNKNTSNTLKAIGIGKLPGVRDVLAESDRQADELIRKGGTTLGSQVLQAVPQAGQQLALAVLSGGTSVPAQLGQNAMLQSAKNIVTSPAFANSMIQSFGGAYGEAKESGASEAQAITAGLLQAIPQSLIEQAGGIETITSKLTNKTKGLVGTALISALEEGLEEIIQYPFEGLAKKATYAPGTPVFSVNENAIINPVEMAQGALVGGVAGGLFGGAANVMRNGVRLPKSISDPTSTITQDGIKAGTLPGQTVDYAASRQTQQTQAEPAQRVSAERGTLAASETDPTLTIRPGQSIGADARTPSGTIPEGMRERGFSQNIRTDAAMNEDIRASFDENPEVYKQISNQKTLEKAQEIFNKGQAEAEADFYQSISSNSFRPADVPLAKMLAQQAAEQGDIGKARQILSSVAEKLTEAGQFSQAAKILREADPETFLMTMDKQLKKLNEQGRKKYGKKWKDVDLTPGEIDMINKLPRGDTQAYEQAWEQIGQRIANDMHVSGMEKFNAWRRMAMLLNPKTHIRNVGGNVIMMGMRKAADTIGAGLERAFRVPEGQRTKSVGWSRDTKVVNLVNQNWDAVKGDLLGESRWTIGDINAINREKRIYKKGLLTRAAEAVMGQEFDRGFLQWLNDVSFKTLNLEDNIFTERAYKDALGQYLHANNLDVVTDEAVEYATRRALEATFKQANMLASFINKAKNVPVAGFFVEGAIPFTKTPANIIMRGIEYSPGGLFKTLYDVKSGKTAATVIEDLSKGLTGSAIMGLAFWLSSMGWAKVERKRSEKAEALYQELGDQTYAINTPLGSYTFDWAQPFSIPFAMGVAASEALRGRKDGDTIIQAVIDGIAAGGDTIFNMTMLQNVRNILGSYGSPTEKIMGIPLDYLEQAIFSVFGQAARAIDPVRRSTYDPSPTKQWWNTVKARIPGLSQTLEPALDIWGQEQYQGGPLQQFISPGYYRERSNDPVTQELARLYESVNDTSILPKTAPNSFTKDKVEYKLSAQQKTEFARIMGQENYIDLNAVIHSEAYQNATDEQKAKMVNKIVEDNYDYAKDVIIGGAR